MKAARPFPIRFLVATLCLAACDDAGIGGDVDEDVAATPRAVYSREMIFVAADATAAALLEFGSAEVGTVIRRSARGWAEDGSGWTPLYDLTWEGPALRRPWRLVPHGPVGLRMGLDEQLEAIAIRDGDAEVAALVTGDFLTEWTPFHTSQLVLREATLALDTDPIRGWLVDASFGVAPQFTSAGDAAFTLGPDSAPADSASDSIAAPAPDSVPRTIVAERRSGTSAASVRSLRAVLFSENGAALVLGDTDTGVAAWFWSVDAEITIQEVALTPVPGTPESWTVRTTDTGRLAGRLEGLDQAPVALAPRMVRGTFAIDGDSLRFHGVMRPSGADE